MRLRVLLTAAVLAAFAFATAVSADSGPCTQTGLSVSCTYSYTGGEQSLAVPSGVTAFHVVAVGAAGGVNASGNGAAPAVATANVAVPAGTPTLYVEVGGVGHNGDGATSPGNGLGGWNGGAAGGAGLSTAAGGGGATDVRTVSCGVCTTQSAPSISSRLVVAGGGGGSGTAGTPPATQGLGGAAGSPGTAGGDDTPGDTGGGGGGAGTTAGGSAGTHGVAGSGGTGTTNGDDGIAGGSVQGGAGGQPDGEPGGGGGGGALGGGGGGSGAFRVGAQAGGGGGGGGSSLAPGGSVQTGDPGQAGSVTISYTLPSPAPPPTSTTPQPPTVTIAKPVNGAKYVKGQPVVVSYKCAAAPGDTIKSCAGPDPSGSTLTLKKVGSYTFSVTATTNQGATATKTVAYRVVAPSKKKGFPVELTFLYAKSKPLKISGALSGKSGALKTELPFLASDFCDKSFTVIRCPKPTPKGSSFELSTKLSKSGFKRASLEVGFHHPKSATLVLTPTTGTSKIKLHYTLSNPYITKVTLKDHGKYVVTVHYATLVTSTSCPTC